MEHAVIDAVDGGPSYTLADLEGRFHGFPMAVCVSGLCGT